MADDSVEWDFATTVRPRPFLGLERVLVADAELGRRVWLREVLAGRYGVEEVESATEALARLHGDPPKVIIVGPYLTDTTGSGLLAAAVRHGLLDPERGGPITFLVADSPEQAAEVPEDQVPIFFRLSPALPAERVRGLVSQAMAQLPAAGPRSMADAVRTRVVLEHVKRISGQPDSAAAAGAAIAAVVDLCQADRAQCLYYDAESGSLWSEIGEASVEGRASAGITGFAARTAGRVALERAAADPMYAAEIDDPQGSGHERLAVQPVAGPDGNVHAVLVAIREPDQPSFALADLERLEALAEAWGPFLHQLALRVEAEDLLEEEAAESAGDEIFRREAIVSLVRRGRHGDVVRVHPAWVRSAYWVVVLSVAAAVGFAAVAPVHEYAEGPGVIRIKGRTEVSVHQAGSVTSLAVVPGQRVAEGDVLAQLHDTAEAAQLRSLDAELERGLVAYLQSPSDPAIQERLASARSRREAAAATLDARVIRAPHAGVVKDVLIRPGQPVEVGKVAFSIAERDEDAGLVVVAFLPGAQRPRLAAGQVLRLSLPGYRDARIELEVGAISPQVLGPDEARLRYLGNRLGDTLPIQGSVVVVEASLASAQFEADGERYQLHDGMVGLADVRLGSESVLETLIPGL